MEKDKYKKLFELRTINNYSFQKMADKLKISKSYYWELENKRRRLYYDMAIKIANIFDLKPDDIFYDKK